MENDTQYKKIYLFNPQYKNKHKIILISLLVVFASIIISYETSIYQLQQKQLKLISQNQTISNSAPNPTSNYSHIALKAYGCFENKNITPEKIWTLQDLYLKTKNEKYLSQLNEYISNLNASSNFDSPLTCLILYDLERHKTLSSIQSQTLKKICLDSENNSQTLVNQIKQNNNSETIKLLFKNKETFTPVEIEDSSSIYDIQKLSLAASNLSGKYGFSKNTSDLNTAYTLYHQALSSFFKKINWTYPEVCSLANASLDLYDSTQNKLFLDISAYLFDQTKTIDKIKNINIFSSGICSRFTTRYYQLSQNPEVKKLTQFLIDEAINHHSNTNHDSQNSLAIDCFYDHDVDQILKPSLENSYLINSLLSFQ